MINFTAQQEIKASHQECSAWIEYMAEEWYSKATSSEINLPADLLIANLKYVFFSCINAEVDDIETISLLGFDVMYALSTSVDAEDIADISHFFIHHAMGDNVDYAQNWIDIYFNTFC